MTSERATRPDIDWEDGEVPRSRRFDDIYFSRRNGLAESRAVFLEGCGLPAAWWGRKAFCVGELGFGAGRNIAALLELWRRKRPAGARLSIFSAEAWPISAGDAARALASWPELGEAARLIIDRWPPAARGFHRIDLGEYGACLDVAVMEAGEALAAWRGTADAWFLDGFSPSKNPQMWRAPLMALVRARSAPGARIATYSAAAAVRKDLTEQGFSVRRVEGYGAKRHSLRATLPGPRIKTRRPARAAVVGAGIAGAALARAFRAEGLEARLFDAGGLGAGASGGEAALVAPRLDAGLGPAAGLFAQAARRAGALYEALGDCVISRGAIQLALGPKDEKRFAAIAGSDLFAPAEVGLIGPDLAAKHLGEAPGRPGLALNGARVVQPGPILRAWAGEVAAARVARLEFVGGAWRLLSETGGLLFEAEVVCLAAAMGSRDLAPVLELAPVRGQATAARGLAWPVASLFGGYVIPTREGLLVGATHQRGRVDEAARPADDAENLAAVGRLFPRLAARLEGARLTGWAAVRATTSDFLPLAGAVPGAAPGLFVLTGLGSRGFCLAPLLAEHVAALALDRPSPLPAAAAALVSPDRFHERARRRRRAGSAPVTAAAGAATT
jgi:tRNA 5-methylaminomethyl-2-thiouridine biosynthesis bifunctional protein